MASSSHSNNLVAAYANLSVNDEEDEGLILTDIPVSNTKVEYDRSSTSCVIRLRVC